MWSSLVICAMIVGFVIAVMLAKNGNIKGLKFDYDPSQDKEYRKLAKKAYDEDGTFECEWSDHDSEILNLGRCRHCKSEKRSNGMYAGTHPCPKCGMRMYRHLNISNCMDDKCKVRMVFHYDDSTQISVVTDDDVDEFTESVINL